MLGFFKGKSKDNIIYSPCKGKVVPITEVSDPTFSEKVLGCLLYTSDAADE